MSHAYGRMCREHKAAIGASHCPEGCGPHGWAYEDCSPDCPEWDAAGSPAPEEGPDDGHTFRITWTSRGSTKVVGDEHHRDAPEFYGGRTIEVRAWSLRDALRKAADLPAMQLMPIEEDEAE